MRTARSRSFVRAHAVLLTLAIAAGMIGGLSAQMTASLFGSTAPSTTVTQQSASAGSSWWSLSSLLSFFQTSGIRTPWSARITRQAEQASVSTPEVHTAAQAELPGAGTWSGLPGAQAPTTDSIIPSALERSEQYCSIINGEWDCSTEPILQAPSLEGGTQVAVPVPINAAASAPVGDVSVPAFPQQTSAGDWQDQSNYCGKLSWVKCPGEAEVFITNDNLPPAPGLNINTPSVVGGVAPSVTIDPTSIVPSSPIAPPSSIVSPSPFVDPTSIVPPPTVLPPPDLNNGGNTTGLDGVQYIDGVWTDGTTLVDPSVGGDVHFVGTDGVHMAASECHDGMDNDGDDFIDVLDSDCLDVVLRENGGQGYMSCYNGLDDDNNSRRDGQEPSCNHRESGLAY